MSRMNDSGREPVTLALAENAAEWFIRLKEGDLNDADRQEYLRWLKHSPAHHGEMLRIGRMYGVLRSTDLTQLSEGAQNVVSLESPAARHARRSLPISKLAAAFGIIALAAVMAIGFYGRDSGNMIETEAGEWRQINLQD